MMAVSGFERSLSAEESESLTKHTYRQSSGEVRFDSERSEREADFRILISPSKWELVKQYSLRHLADQDDMELESLPHRELVEEFAETLGVSLEPDQYTFRPTGFVIENQSRTNG